MVQDYGRRIVCNVLQSVARTDPKRLFANVAKGNSVSDGFYEFSYEQVARAVNFLSSWLQDRFENGKTPNNHPTLCFIGVPDIRYSIIVYAALQCGYKIFLPSPRNTTDVNLTMLQQLDCSRVVYVQETYAIIKKLEDKLETLNYQKMLDVGSLLEVPDTPYMFDLDYSRAMNDPAIILHSSGSTGIPKTVTWTHGTLATLDYRNGPCVPGRTVLDLGTIAASTKEGSSSYDPFPPFHAAGVAFKILSPVWFDRPPIFGPASRPPSAVLAAQILRHFEPAVIALPPSIIEQLLGDSDSEQLLRKLTHVVCTGGPMSREAGSRLVTYTNVYNMFASTEVCLLRQLAQDAGKWSEYLEFDPYEDLIFEKIDGDIYELVVPVSSERKDRSAVYHNLPNISRFRTKDLFQQHPTNPSLWKYYGRADDILVFSSGEKLYPLSMELALTALPGISGALVVGQAQRQSALLIELNADADLPDDAVKSLWPSIEAANALLPGHGRVSENMVLIAKPEKPFKRAAKGSVVRRLTEKLYEEEIKSLYGEHLVAKAAPIVSFAPSAYRYDDIKLTLKQIFQTILPNVQIEDDQNLYNIGMDSIKTTEVLQKIKASMRSARPDLGLSWLSMDTLFTYFSISKLATVLLAFFNEGKIPDDRDRIAHMKTKIKGYTQNLPKITPAPHNIPLGGLSVAVTGTTGFLGRYLVTELLQIEQISRVYCLNRSPVAKDRYYAEARPPTDKEVVFMKCNFSAPKLGLNDEDYLNVCENCSLILHNAWPVNFNLPIDAFEENIRSVRQMVDLSAAARLHPRIVFVSTFATTGVKGFEGDAQQTIPEGPVDGLKSVVGLGYAEAKRVSERILEVAATECGISVTLIRLGQLVPEDGGALPTSDHLTIFLKTCRALQSITEDLYEMVDWVPVHLAARILAEVVQANLTNGPTSDFKYLNLVNPDPKPWSEHFRVVDRWCGKDLTRIGARAWVDKLIADGARESRAFQDKPALLVMQLYNELLKRRGPSHQYQTDQLKSVSKSMAHLTAIRPESLASWLQHINV